MWLCSSKKPPCVTASEQCVISERFLDKWFNVFPRMRKISRAIECDAICRSALGDKKKLFAAFEYKGIGEMERLAENNPIVFPIATITARCETNLATTHGGVHYLKEHVPCWTVFDPKWVRDELRPYIRYVTGGQDGIENVWRLKKIPSRGSLIDTDRPIIRCRNRHKTTPCKAIRCNRRRYGYCSQCGTDKPSFCRHNLFLLRNLSTSYLYSRSICPMPLPSYFLHQQKEAAAGR